MEEGRVLIAVAFSRREDSAELFQGLSARFAPAEDADFEHERSRRTGAATEKTLTEAKSGRR